MAVGAVRIMLQSKCVRRHGARVRTNESAPKPSPDSRSQPNSTFLLWPARSSCGENSRTEMQNVVTDSTANNFSVDKKNTAIAEVVRHKDDWKVAQHTLIRDVFIENYR